MARKTTKPAADATVLPPVVDAAAPAISQPPVPASKDAAEAQAGVGGAPADLKEGAETAPVNTSEGASDDAPNKVATQMPEEQAAVPPAAGDAPVANPFPADVGIVIVQGPAKGRWRAGRHFTPEPTFILLADLTHDEMVAIGTDPELMVSVHPAA